MEVSEPEEWLLEGIAPVRVEKLSDVFGGGEVESVVIGLEVAVEHVDVGGELSQVSVAHGAAEQRKEVVAEGVDPVGVVVLEVTRRFLAAKQTYKIDTKLHSNAMVSVIEETRIPPHQYIRLGSGIFLEKTRWWVQKLPTALSILEDG